MLGWTSDGPSHMSPNGLNLSDSRAISWIEVMLENYRSSLRCSIGDVISERIEQTASLWAP